MTIYVTKSPTETHDLGRRIGGRLKPGDVVALIGSLGTGKTCLTQGIAEGLEVRSDQTVNSPTFTLINEYRGKYPLYHFDVYRLRNIEEMFDLGFEDYFYGDGVTIIEWAEKIELLLPEEYIRIELTWIDDTVRRIELVNRNS